MFKLLMNILCDQRGTWGAVAIGAGVAGGGAAIGSVFGKNKQSVYDPYSQLRDQYKNYLGSKLGTTTPYKYNDAFTLNKPPVEQAAEDTILGKLKNMPQQETDLFGVYDKYAKARAASAQEKNNVDLKEQQNMYNRLGLVSSTPYLQDSAELKRKQGVDMDLVNADIAREGVGATRAAYETNNNISNSWVNQAHVLGQIQREAQKFGIQMSEDDIKRMIDEEQGWASITGNLINGNPPQVSYTPNWAAKLGGALTGIGGNIATAGVLGGAGGAARLAGGATGFAGGGSPTPMCWVAAEVLADGDMNHPRVCDVRYFIQNMAPQWFRALYLKYGQRFAAYLKHKTILKNILRPLFNIFATLGHAAQQQGAYHGSLLSR